MKPEKLKEAREVVEKVFSWSVNSIGEIYPLDIAEFINYFSPEKIKEMLDYIELLEEMMSHRL